MSSWGTRPRPTLPIVPQEIWQVVFEIFKIDQFLKTLNLNHFLSQRDSSEKGEEVERSVVTASGVYAAAGNLRYFLRTIFAKNVLCILYVHSYIFLKNQRLDGPGLVSGPLRLALPSPGEEGAHLCPQPL